MSIIIDGIVAEPPVAPSNEEMNRLYRLHLKHSDRMSFHAFVAAYMSDKRMGDALRALDETQQRLDRSVVYRIMGRPVEWMLRVARRVLALLKKTT